MKAMRNLLMTVICFFSVSMAHAGIPVVDGLLNGQTIENQIANVITWGSQLTQLENQYQQAVTMYNAVKGARGMAALLSNPAVYSNLPPQYASVVSSIKSGATYATERAALPTSTNLKINAIYDSVAVHKAALTDAYSQASARLVQIQQLQQSIDSATDPAAKNDLQNRMVSELQSIQGTIHLLGMLQPKQQRDIEEAQNSAHQSFVCAEFASTAANCAGATAAP
ncbi:MAG TPA: type IV secretion system protein [Burkholderiaceae bacterium]|nr:type IV secretion system protein [Burkholderiaceae bacterium]